MIWILRKPPAWWDETSEKSTIGIILTFVHHSLHLVIYDCVLTPGAFFFLFFFFPIFGRFRWIFDGQGLEAQQDVESQGRCSCSWRAEGVRVASSWLSPHSRNEESLGIVCSADKCQRWAKKGDMDWHWGNQSEELELAMLLMLSALLLLCL